MELLMKRKLGRESRDYLAITFGLICYSIGWAAFMLPYQITTGGVTGIYDGRCDGYRCYHLLRYRDRNPGVLFHYQCHLHGVCFEDTGT